MPSTRDIRRRIRSVKNTAQITKAMQMVASAKMRKAQQAALAGRPYAILMNQMIVSSSKDSHDFTHPLMEKQPLGGYAGRPPHQGSSRRWPGLFTIRLALTLLRAKFSLLPPPILVGRPSFSLPVAW